MAELPEAERPKAITAALAEVETALGRLREVGQQRFAAAERQMQLRRQANSVLVGQGGVDKKQWDNAQKVWHEAKDDLALVQQVNAAAEEAVSEARQALAGAVLKHSSSWQQALERRWLKLDAEAEERLAALRSTEIDRASVANAHTWLLSALMGDVLAQLGRPYRQRGGWRSRLLRRSGETYYEHELLAGLEELLNETALQRRLDAKAAEAREEQERQAELRQEQERRIADARIPQEARLARLQTAPEAEAAELAEG
jgi:hypothetical protein